MSTDATTAPTATTTTETTTTAPSLSADAAPSAPSKSNSGRPPTLNQLAARITASGNAVAPPASSSQPSRPRLAANLLRTNSQVSLSSTAASVTDSVNVNPPSTRSGSPTSSITSTSRASSPLSTTVAVAAAINGGGEALTAEKVGKLNAESDKKPIGYKNIPNLSAIAKRMQMNRQLSIDGSTKPPEPETYEDPATPGIPQKVPEHPLQSPWTMHYDNTKAKVPFTPAPAPHEVAHPSATEEDYEAGLTVIGDFSTVETFCRYFNWLKPPSQLERNSNYHLFKTGIKPMWEDEANANGGKWVLTMKNTPQLLDRCWSWLTMALVGEELDEGDEICGAVVSLKSKVDRIQLWIRSKDDVEKVNRIGKKLLKLLDVTEADGIGLEFQYNSDDRPPPNKYLSIFPSFPQSSFRSSFSLRDSGSFSGNPASGHGDNSQSSGAFGAFSTGRGGWRPGKRESTS